MSLWRCCVMLLKEIHFLTWGFPFLAMFRSYREQFRLFVAWRTNTVVFLLIFCYLDFVIFQLVLRFLLLLLAAPLSLSLLIFVYSFGPWIVASTQTWRLPFLLLFLIIWSFSLVLFKNGPKYLTRGTRQIFIPVKRFSRQRLVSGRFRVLLTYSFQTFSFVSV